MKAPSARLTFRKLVPVIPRLNRGYLAEDYDGIGQYVLVALARSSVGSAYRARIAAGDFGGGRMIPIGTPVVVHSLHGQLEIFLGNRPVAGGGEG